MAQSTLLYAALATPVNAAFSTATTGGTLAAATYYYRVSALDANGETLASPETSQVTTGATSTVTVNWGAVPGATGYKVYGRTTGAELLIATVGNVTTYTDTGSVTPAGALPTENTTSQFAATSANSTVASGASISVGLYVTSGTVRPGMSAVIQFITPGAVNRGPELDHATKQVQINGPCTFNVRRHAPATAFGVFAET